MTYEEAKRRQIEAFRAGIYYVLQEVTPGEYFLVKTQSKLQSQENLAKDAIAEVKRFPTKLRIIPGGKA